MINPISFQANYKTSNISSSSPPGYRLEEKSQGNVIQKFLFTGDEQIGSITAFKQGPLKRRPHIQSLTINEQHQNKGLGSFLVKSLITELSKIGKEISVYDTHRGTLYDRLGFKETEENDGLGGQKYKYKILILS
jgi:N-acetylglutamate synthase-like GNAT family acetyltransferase